MTILCADELYNMKMNIEVDAFREVKYLDTWDYEEEYSHGEIYASRQEFIEEANNYFIQNNLPYTMREVCENAMICDKVTGKILRNR